MGFRKRHSIPDLGVGVGFRLPHYAQVLEDALECFEAGEHGQARDGYGPLDVAERLEQQDGRDRDLAGRPHEARGHLARRGGRMSEWALATTQPASARTRATAQALS